MQEGNDEVARGYVMGWLLCMYGGYWSPVCTCAPAVQCCRTSLHTHIRRHTSVCGDFAGNAARALTCERLCQRKLQALKGMGGGLTTSFLPGTTLGITELDLGNGRSLFDTPGLIVPSQLTNRLIMEELAAVLPQKRVEHVTYRINPGSCVHLGGMACVELVEEPDAKAFFITIFVSNEVSVHVGKIAKAQEFREKHLGKMLSPPFSLERLEEMGGLVPTVHTGSGDSWSTACVDVVVSGLGWVALTGIGPFKVRTWAPPGVAIIMRDPLMPFEARTSTESYTGGGDKKGNSRRTKQLKMPGQAQSRGGSSQGRGQRGRGRGSRGGSFF